MDEVPGEPNAGAAAVECVVCHRPIAGRVYTIAGRSYCREDYSCCAPGSRGAWPSVLALLAGMLGFALLMQVVGPTLSPALDGGWRTAIGLALAVLPALLWISVFRRLDRLEQEPHHHLLAVMLLGALLAGAVGDPLRRGLYALDLWSDGRPQWAIPAFALTQGMLLASIVYAAVRWSVFLLDEFDERADGIIYGTAAGLGVGVLYNVRYVLESDGLRLDVGVARIVVAALVMASIGGLVGYGLGQVKFERHSAWYLPGFVLLAALLTGVFEWLTSEAATTTLGYSAWAAVVVAAIFAALVFGAVFALLRVAVRETLAAPGVA